MPALIRDRHFVRKTSGSKQFVSMRILVIRYLQYRENRRQRFLPAAVVLIPCKLILHLQFLLPQKAQTRQNAVIYGLF